MDRGYPLRLRRPDREQPAADGAAGGGGAAALPRVVRPPPLPRPRATRIKDGVPEGWESRTLGDLCQEVRESVKPDTLEPDTPYIGLEHMPRRSIALSEWGTAEEVTSNKHRFREG